MAKLSKSILSVVIAVASVFSITAFSACGDNTNDNNNNNNSIIDNSSNNNSSDNNTNDTTTDNTQTDNSTNDTTTDNTQTDSKNVLVVYFSWSSSATTEKLANYIGEYLNATVIEIEAAEPYTGSYSDVAYGRAQTEAQNDARPEVAQATYDKIDMSQYDTVFVGYPIWWWTTPMIIATFLEHYDWTGKDIHPFSQSSSMNTTQYNTSVEKIKSCASNATVHDGVFTKSTTTIEQYLIANGFTKN